MHSQSLRCLDLWMEVLACRGSIHRAWASLEVAAGQLATTLDGWSPAGARFVFSQQCTARIIINQGKMAPKLLWTFHSATGAVAVDEDWPLIWFDTAKRPKKNRNNWEIYSNFLCSWFHWKSSFGPFSWNNGMRMARWVHFSCTFVSVPLSNTQLFSVQW